MSESLIYHVNVKYGDQEVEVYIPRVRSSSEKGTQIINGTLTVNSEQTFNKYKQYYSINNYILQMSPDDVTGESYIDLMVKSGIIPEDQRDEELSKFNQLSPEEQENRLSEIKNSIADIHAMVENADTVEKLEVRTQGYTHFYN